MTGKRICMLGGTGAIGRATVAALVQRGHEVVCLVRARSALGGLPAQADDTRTLAGIVVRQVDFSEPQSLTRDGFAGEHFDALVSCMASRTGAPKDAWATDHRAHLAALVASGLRYSIVRPTAFFKSLSGQIHPVRAGQPFLIVGDGTLTACKPFSDAELADYLADCLIDESCWDCILPIGGPGAAITPRQQGEALFAMLGRPPRFRSVPVALLHVVAGGLGAVGRLVPALADTAELARIGRYYATESMLVLDPQTGRYDADATPSTGSETLLDFYRSVLAGTAMPERGDHAVF